MTGCSCTDAHQRRRVVLTGGPGAGKTAVLELIRQSLCEHVKVLPEAAGVVFGGGFPPPEPREEFWPSLRTTLKDELDRYDTVIHLRTPAVDRGYNRSNPLRTESAAAAAAIDARILEAWAEHPRRFVVESSDAFLDKATQALEIIRGELPDCCAHHADLPRRIASVPTAVLARRESSMGPPE